MFWKVIQVPSPPLVFYTIKDSNKCIALRKYLNMWFWCSSGIIKKKCIDERWIVSMIVSLVAWWSYYMLQMVFGCLWYIVNINNWDVHLLCFYSQSKHDVNLNHIEFLFQKERVIFRRKVNFCENNLIDFISILVKNIKRLIS